MLKDKYPDFGPTFASEQLSERERINVSRETVRQWMMEAGLRKAKQAKAAAPRPPRERAEQEQQIGDCYIMNYKNINKIYEQCQSV